jgi:hypothetical protein
MHGNGVMTLANGMIYPDGKWENGDPKMVVSL